MKHIKGKLSFSKQNGTPGHCVAAQVFDEIMSVAVIEPTEDEQDATDLAMLFHAAPDLLKTSEAVLNIIVKGHLILNVELSDHLINKEIMIEAMGKAFDAIEKATK